MKCELRLRRTFGFALQAGRARFVSFEGEQLATRGPLRCATTRIATEGFVLICSYVVAPTAIEFFYTYRNV
eukprot:3677563-Prymnesium_polylepis.1